MLSNSYPTTRHADEDVDRHIYCDSADGLLYYASSYYLFHDYGVDPIDLTEIVLNGQKLEFAGWLPHKIVKFRDLETKQIIWTKQL